jgi:DNA-binding NtrC family response regulator
MSAKSSAKILIVDDEPIVRDTLEMILLEVYDNVETARDGQGALALLEKGRYDLVISDMRMPGVGGIELGRRIKERWPGTPLILMSGTGDSEHCPDGSRFLAKPFPGFDFVFEAVAEALRSGGVR